MRDKSIFYLVPTIVIASAAIAYVLVYMTPWFRGSGSYWRTTSVTPHYDDSSWGDAYSFDGAVRNAVTELAKRQPSEVQALVKELWNDLKKADEASLYVIKSLPDVCLGEIDCRGIPGKDVRPFVEAAIAHAQARETARISSDGITISKLSLVVAVAAFLASIAGLFIKAKG